MAVRRQHKKNAFVCQENYDGTGKMRYLFFVLQRTISVGDFKNVFYKSAIFH